MLSPLGANRKVSNDLLRFLFALTRSAPLLMILDSLLNSWVLDPASPASLPGEDTNA